MGLGLVDPLLISPLPLSLTESSRESLSTDHTILHPSHHSLLLNFMSWLS